MRRRETGIFVKIAVFAFAVFAVITLVQLQLEANSLKAEIADLNAEKDELTDKKEEMQNQLAGVNDKEHIIEVAKDKLNLRLPEEIIFYNDLYN